jgi:hypothetical protein
MWREREKGERGRVIAIDCEIGVSSYFFPLLSEKEVELDLEREREIERER